MPLKFVDLITTERHRLPLWFPVGLGLGIGLYFAQPAPLPMWPLLTAALAVAALAVLLRGHGPLRLALIMFFSLLLGASTAALRLEAVHAPVLLGPVFFQQVEGVVENIQPKEKKVKLVLSSPSIATVAPQDTPRRISITLRKLEVPLQVGQRITLAATLFPPPGPALPGAHDFARMFYFEQLGAVGFSPRQPELLCSGGSCSMQGHQQDDWEKELTALRLSIADRLVAVMGGEMGAIASALMVGEQSRVSEEASDSMRGSGIYHILSISGLHMSLATGIIFFVVRFLLVAIPHAARNWPTKKLAAGAGLLGGFAYLLLAGAPVPAVRSYIMVACVLFAILVDRKGISMFSLAWAASLILLFMPESLFSASFQLSFAATLAIVALYERFGSLFFHAHAGPIRRIFLYFLGLMITSAAVTFYTTPLGIAHFNRTSLYGIFANMLVVPLSSILIMPMALVTFITMPFGWEWPMHLLKLGLEWMMMVSYFFSGMPYAQITLPGPTPSGLALIVAGGLWLALWIGRVRYLGLPMMLLGLATIALFRPYDLIIDDDARRVAYRSLADEWVLVRGKPESFESEIWLRMQGKETALARRNAPDEVSCDKELCTIIRERKRIIITLKRTYMEEVCDEGADIVVASQYFRCENVGLIIDRAYVEMHGAVAIRLGPLSVETTQASRGNWPWSKNLVAGEDDANMPQNMTGRP